MAPRPSPTARPITITTDTPAPPTPATPYPSTITVSGMIGPVSDVDVRLNGFSHGTANDVDLLLVGPSGANLVLLSDPGDPSVRSSPPATPPSRSTTPPRPASPQSGIISGTVSYRPTDNDAGGAADSFPSPAPAPSTATTLGTFTGTNPNGTWSLYVVDDAHRRRRIDRRRVERDDHHLVGGGTDDDGGDLLGQPVDGRRGGHLYGHRHQWREPRDDRHRHLHGRGDHPGHRALSASGQASFSTSALVEGCHTITATYNGTAAFQMSSGSVAQVVQRATTSTALTSSLDPSTVGQSVTFTAGAPVTADLVPWAPSTSLMAGLSWRLSP